LTAAAQRPEEGERYLRVQLQRREGLTTVAVHTKLNPPAAPEESDDGYGGAGEARRDEPRAVGTRLTTKPFQNAALDGQRRGVAGGIIVNNHPWWPLRSSVTHHAHQPAARAALHVEAGLGGPRASPPVASQVADDELRIHLDHRIVGEAELRDRARPI